MKQHTILPRVVIALGCILLLGLAVYMMTRPTLAHEMQPLGPPVIAACYETANSCDLTSNRPADGKSWLPQPLISNGALRAATLKPLSDVPCTDGFADVFPCANVDLLAFLPHTMIGGDTNNDMWGWTDPVTGKEYAMVGARDGVAFVDISMPTAPRFLGKLPTHATRSSWRDLKVYQAHVFVVADKNQGHGMQVFDLHQLRTLTATTETTATLLLSETAHYNGFSDAHNLAINEETGYAYAVGSETCSSGLHMVDIRDVNTPQFAGCYSEDGYIHDTQCIIYRGPDPDYQGRELCFNSSVSQMTIVDVTDKSAPTRLSAIAVKGNIYMHQGWLTPDRHYFLLDDEMDEWFGRHNTRTYIFDVSDIDAPQFVNAYTAALPSVDHNLYITGTYAYEANYTTGLRILDLKAIQEGNLTETAFFDTYPENNDAWSAGAWTAYPFFKSGVVAISTLDRGLFLVKPRLTPDVILADRQSEVNLCTDATGQRSLPLPLTLQARNGYAQAVTLRTSPLPTTLSATFSPAQVDLSATTTASSTLTLQGGAAASGSYTVTVEAVTADQQVLDRGVVKVHLANASAATPLLQKPEQQTTLHDLTALPFSWSHDGSADRYQVEIASDPTFTTTVYTLTLSSPGFTLAPPATTASWTMPLSYNQQYYWRVTATNRCGTAVSATNQFQTPRVAFLPIIKRPPAK
ncbi:MAG: choice-of-anchor B family protein [Caldilineaceae bacterium]